MSVDADLPAVAGHGLQLTLAVVFTAAVIPKLRRPGDFVQALRGYELVPRPWQRPVGLVLIGVETFLAFAFVAGRLMVLALPLALASLLAFLAGTVIALRRGLRVSCGCFGDAGEVISKRTVARLGLMLAAATGAGALRLGADVRALPLEKLVTDGPPAVALACVLLVLGSWLLSLPELISVLRRSRRVPESGSR